MLMSIHHEGWEREGSEMNEHCINIMVTQNSGKLSAVKFGVDFHFALLFAQCSIVKTQERLPMSMPSKRTILE